MTFKHCEDGDHHVNQINIIKSYLPKMHFRFSRRGAGTFMSTPNLKKINPPVLASAISNFEIPDPNGSVFEVFSAFGISAAVHKFQQRIHVDSTRAPLQLWKHIRNTSEDSTRHRQDIFPRVGCSLRVGLKKTRKVP